VSFEITTATVASVSFLTSTMIQYFIKPNKYVEYFAGQYLQIEVLGESYSYSIANAPFEDGYYELHIRHGNNSQVLLALQKNAEIKIKLPFGDCYLSKMNPTMPIIFIAVGSGFAPIKAILEQLFVDEDRREKKLYWWGRTQEDLYLQDAIMSWQSKDENFKYNSYISQNNEDSLISQVINQNIKNLLNYQIVMCGPFELIYKMRDALLTVGMNRENLYSDAFSFES